MLSVSLLVTIAIILDMVAVEGVLLARPDVSIPPLPLQAGPSMNMPLLPANLPKLAARTFITSPEIAPVIALASLLGTGR